MANMCLLITHSSTIRSSFPISTWSLDDFECLVNPFKDRYGSNKQIMRIVYRRWCLKVTSIIIHVSKRPEEHLIWRIGSSMMEWCMSRVFCSHQIQCTACHLESSSTVATPHCHLLSRKWSDLGWLNFLIFMMQVSHLKLRTYCTFHTIASCRSRTLSNMIGSYPSGYRYDAQLTYS